MSQTLSRRLFFALTGSAIATPAISWAASDIPDLLDHIILGCSNLDRGIAFLEERTGVRAVFGGVHPGLGTHNALASFGSRRYLEIIAPDPKQSSVQAFPVITQLAEPRLVGWAAHPSDLDAFATKLQNAGVPVKGPRVGSRARPDGRTLRWKSLALADDRKGVLPFFIEWNPDSPHPSTDAPPGCHLEYFGLVSPDLVELTRTLERIGVAAPVESGEKLQLRARITGPKGKLEVTSA